MEENKPKVVQIDNKNKKQKEKQKESKLTKIQNREKEIANKAYQKEKIDEKPVIEHGEKEIILEIEEPITQTLKEEVEKIMVNRYGDPQEVAYLVKFLVSKEADFINNTVIRIDGGQKGSC